MTEVERRSMGRVELRAASEGKPAQLVGYAAVFNSRSEDLGGFREIIMPGAFDRRLGRTASKTTRLEVDEKGLRAEIDVPDTQDGRDTLTLVQRGDLSQMSFA